MSDVYKVGSTLRYKFQCKRRDATGHLVLFDPDPFVVTIRSEDGQEDATRYGAPTEIGKSVTRLSVGVYVLSYVLQPNQVGMCELGSHGTLTEDAVGWPQSQRDNYRFRVIPDPLLFVDS